MKILEFDKYEIGIITNALLCFRNKQLEEKGTTEPIDELLIKIVETPEKKRPFLKILMRDSYVR